MLIGRHRIVQGIYLAVGDSLLFDVFLPGLRLMFFNMASFSASTYSCLLA
ncbi:MAG: hypothetical protein ACJAT7_003304, partial [Psychromonas sp.]